MLRLRAETPASWVQAAEAQLPSLLVDHAHCEKKAASTAINLIFRYQWDEGLMRPLSALAREELAHFEQMLDVLRARDIPFAPLPASPYAARLHAAASKQEPDRLLDALLVCAFIEARSCDRMQRLAEHLTDRALAAVYADLLTSEARHHALYVDLALDRFPKEQVFARLAWWSEVEAATLDGPPEGGWMHDRWPVG